MGGCVSSWTINAFGGTKRIDAKNNFDGEYDEICAKFLSIPDTQCRSAILTCIEPMKATKSARLRIGLQVRVHQRRPFTERPSAALMAGEAFTDPENRR